MQLQNKTKQNDLYWLYKKTQKTLSYIGQHKL